jgi:hypothetical protein
MANPPRYPDTGAEPDDEPTSGAPRWVRVMGITLIILLLLVAIVMLVGGGEHGPGRHATSGGARGQAPPSDVTALQAPPVGGLR